jgi:hypothetical protein
MLPQYLPTTGRPYGREPTLRFGANTHDRHGSIRNTIVKKLMGKNTMLYIAITFVMGFFLVLMLSGTPPDGSWRKNFRHFFRLFAPQFFLPCSSGRGYPSARSNLCFKRVFFMQGRVDRFCSRISRRWASQPSPA